MSSTGDREGEVEIERHSAGERGRWMGGLEEGAIVRGYGGVFGDCHCALERSNFGFRESCGEEFGSR